MNINLRASLTRIMLWEIGLPALLITLLLPLSVTAQIVLPSYLEVTVDTLSDGFEPPGCSLREAIETINAGGNRGGCLGTSRAGNELDTVRFSNTILPGQIFLSDRIAVTAGLRLLGPEAMTLEISGSNLVQLLAIDGQSSGAEVRNLVLTQGFFNGNGGAISSLAPLAVHDSIISSSASTGVGGAVLAANGLSLSNVVFQDNMAASGGAVYSQGPLQVLNSRFVSNTASGSFNGGGAIWIEHGGTPAVAKVISETVFSSNQAASGGAILVSNTGNDPSLPLIIETSTFEHNRASGGGSAVMQQDAGTITMRRSLFEDALGSQGETQLDQEPVAGDMGLMQLENSTVVGNDGLRVNSQLDLRSVTVVLTTPQAGAAVHIEPGKTARIRDSILLSEAGAGCLGAAANVVENENNLLFVSTCAETGPNLLADDAQLTALMDNGGPTLTMAPLPDSPVINAGSIFCPAIDQRGEPRTDGACDIGAVEAAPSDALFADSFELP